jgi:hypothetical protein
VAPLKYLAPGLGIRGSNGSLGQAIGYAIMRVRVKGIASFDEDTLFVVVEDVSGSGQMTHAILGTPVICRAFNIT